MSRIASLGWSEGRFQLSLQRFHYGESVALVAKKVESPRNEILPLTLGHAGVAGSTVGTLCLRVSSHYGCTFFSVDLSYADQQGKDWA